MKNRIISIISIVLILNTFTVMANPVVLPQPQQPIPWVPIILVVATITVVGLIVFFWVRHRHRHRIYHERIEFNVDGNGKVLVEGSYHLKNLTETNDKSQIFYPLPNKTDSLISAKIDNNDSNISLSYSRFENYEGYNISFDPNVKDSTLLTVAYQEQPVNNHCRYILLSTRYWENSIGKAEFIIKTPQDKPLKYSNFKYTALGIINGKNEYKITETELWPTEDLEFAWE